MLSSLQTTTPGLTYRLDQGQYDKQTNKCTIYNVYIVCLQTKHAVNRTEPKFIVPITMATANDQKKLHTGFFSCRCAVEQILHSFAFLVLLPIESFLVLELVLVQKIVSYADCSISVSFCKVLKHISYQPLYAEIYMASYFNHNGDSLMVNRQLRSLLLKNRQQRESPKNANHQKRILYLVCILPLVKAHFRSLYIY